MVVTLSNTLQRKIEGLQTTLDDMHTELKDLRTDLNDLRTDLNGRIDQVQAEVRKYACHCRECPVVVCSCAYAYV